MTIFTTQEADAYDDAEKRDIDCGKALKNNSMVCPECGSALGVFPKNKGNSIICQNITNCRYSNFEPYDK